MPQFRKAPARYFDGAPAIVKAQVLDLIKITPAAPLDFDVILRPEPEAQEVTGLDFDRHGAQGCHFFLKPHEARAPIVTATAASALHGVTCPPPHNPALSPIWSPEYDTTNARPRRNYARRI